MARDKRVARPGRLDLFEDEAGQGLRPPEGRTWAPRGDRPVVKVRGAGGGRVSIAGVGVRPAWDRPHLYYQLQVRRRRKGEPKGFTWSDYRDMIIATRQGPPTPVVWCWDGSVADFAATGQVGPVRIIKCKLKEIQYRPHLVNGCLATTGLENRTFLTMHYESNLVNSLAMII